MKFYKIKLPHTKEGYRYPDGYEDSIGVHNQAHVYYDDPDDGMFTLLIAIPDKNALPSLPENVVEVTKVEAATIGDQFDPSVETITNEAVVRRLEIKSRLGQQFTQKELDALDPEKGEAGFGKTVSFSTKINAK